MGKRRTTNQEDPVVIQNSDPTEANAAAVPDEVNSDTVVRPQDEDSRGRGQTKIATRIGQAFRPNEDHGVDFDVTSDGVLVTKEQAEAIMAEANALYGDNFVRVVTDEG